MNILFFQNLENPIHGGVPRVTSIISEQLEREGYHCFYCNYWQEDSPFYITQKRIDLCKGDNFVSFCERNKIDYIINQTSRSRKHFNLFREYKTTHPSCKVISVLHMNPDYCNMDYNVEVPDFRPLYLKIFLKYQIAKWLYRIYNTRKRSLKFVIDNSDKMIVLSKSYIQDLLNLYDNHIDSSKIYAIANPLTFGNNISVSELPNKRKIILMSSRLVEGQKRIFQALMIWKELCDIGKTQDWILKIIGDGPHKRAYERYCIENNLRNVKFYGNQKNVLDFYKESSIFIMTSICEGFPMSLTEAIQNGCVPIVFDSFHALHDIVKNGYNGYCIAYNDRKTFAEKLYKLMIDKQLRLSMAENGLHYIDIFKPEGIVKKWINILK